MTSAGSLPRRPVSRLSSIHLPLLVSRSLCHNTTATRRCRCSSSLVRVFPLPTVTFPADSPGLGWCCRFDRSVSGCVSTVINGGFSFTVPSHLLPLPGPRGFLLHTVTRLHGPRLISTTRESATLCSLRASALSGFVRFGFLPRLATHSGQSRRASLGKALQPPHIPSASTSVRFTGYWISPFRVSSTRFPIPFRRFTVRYIRGFYLMLPLHVAFLPTQLPCWCSPSVR